MGYKFNPFTGSLDTVDSPNGVFEEVEINGDITLDDGGTYTTTLQTITPTANRTISLPDATGTVALVAGSSGQLVYNNAGANAGVSTFTADSSGRLTNSASSAASLPVKLWNGTIFAGTTPHVLIQPSAASAGSWSASGTALGVNTAAAFGGNLLDLQVNGTSQFKVTSGSSVRAATYFDSTGVYGIQTNSGGITYIDSQTNFVIRNAASGYSQLFRVTATGVRMPTLPTYADNAAATTGGLVAGDVYKTATGELRITV